jgi:hypothetical protein
VVSSTGRPAETLAAESGAAAAASEPEVADELSARLKVRDAWVRRVAEIIEPGLTSAQAAALLSALALPELYRELVTVRGWTPDAYQTWLQRTLTRQLLATSQPRTNQKNPREITRRHAGLMSASSRATTQSQAGHRGVGST